MKKRETDTELESRVNRCFTGRWSMTESAVILEKPVRTITSYVTGQVYRVPRGFGLRRILTSGCKLLLPTNLAKSALWIPESVAIRCCS